MPMFDTRLFVTAQTGASAVFRSFQRRAQCFMAGKTTHVSTRGSFSPGVFTFMVGNRSAG